MNILAIYNRSIQTSAYYSIVADLLVREFQAFQNINYRAEETGEMSIIEKQDWLTRIVQAENIDLVIAFGQNALHALTLPEKVKKIVVNPLLRPDKIVELNMLNMVNLSKEELICLRHIGHLAVGGYISLARRRSTHAIFIPDWVRWNHFEYYLTKYDPKKSLHNWTYDSRKISPKHDDGYSHIEYKKQRAMSYLTDDIIVALSSFGVDLFT